MICVSLTTIPNRIKNLGKSVESLLNQTVKPNKIFINIPKKYKRFDENINDQQIPKFNDGIIEIVRCEDCGPGTKLLGSIENLNKNNLLAILVDDDHYYENYMIEEFNNFYLKAPENAYSFYVHQLRNFGVGQGADGFAINGNSLNGIKKFYEEVVNANKDLFIHDDLWISFFLFYVKKIKILSLQSRLRKKSKNDQPLIYKKHSKDIGLIESYGKNINDAIRKRDEIAFKNMNYMFDKINKVKF